MKGKHERRLNELFTELKEGDKDGNQSKFRQAHESVLKEDRE